MNAPLTRELGDADRAIVEQYRAQAAIYSGFASFGVAKAPSFARFETLGLPGRRVESWHYTDLRGALRKALPVAYLPDASARAAARPAIGALRKADVTPVTRLVVLDGIYDSELSSSHVPAGLRVISSCHGLIDADENSIAAYSANGLGNDDGAVAANGALALGGVLLRVDDGVMVDDLIEIVFASSGLNPLSIYSRSGVFMGQNSGLRIVERRLGAPNSQRNEALFLSIGKGAILRHAGIYQAGFPSEVDVVSTMIDLEEGSELNSHVLMFGSQLRRRQAFVRMSGRNARCSFAGVSLLRGKEHADTTIELEHVAPHCESREMFHAIVDGDATGVFQGRISVAPHAQKTDGRMRSRAILLSDGAAMYNKPELEIFADDVTCGHGATCGQLDQEQLFYAQSRGIPRPEAEALILEGFAGEILGGINNENLREAMMNDVRAWLAERGE